LKKFLQINGFSYVLCYLTVPEAHFLREQILWEENTATCAAHRHGRYKLYHRFSGPTM